MKQAKSLSRPTLLQIVMGGVITVLYDAFHISRPVLPQQIGNYKLLSNIRKDRGYRYPFSLGVYTYNKKKYFIKHWEGKIKDMNYYNLVNEYFLSDLMAKKLHNVTHSFILAPKVIEYITESNTFSVVYEYIEGKSLLSFPEKTRFSVLSSSLSALQHVSASLTTKEKSYFTKRSANFYLISFLPLSLFVLLMNMQYARNIIANFLKAIAIFFHMPNIPYRIAHRDLDATNIVMSGKDAYLTDFESMVMTFPGYDMIWIALSPDIKKIPSYFQEVLQKPENIFLRIYIIFHLTLSANAMPELRRKYLEMLEK